MLILCSRYKIHVNSVVVVMALYLASTLDQATVGCILEDQEMQLAPKNM